jgi:hypothetical protein
MQTYRTDLRVGDSLSIDGGRITMTLEEKSGQRARLSFTSEGDVRFAKNVQGRTGATHAAKGIKTQQV